MHFFLSPLSTDDVPGIDNLPRDREGRRWEFQVPAFTWMRKSDTKQTYNITQRWKAEGKSIKLDEEGLWQAKWGGAYNKCPVNAFWSNIHCCLSCSPFSPPSSLPFVYWFSWQISNGFISSSLPGSRNTLMGKTSTFLLFMDSQSMEGRIKIQLC